MKKLLGIFVFGLLLSGCGDSGSDYDKGYDDGYDGETPRKSSSVYLEGYEDGEFDGDCDYYKHNNMWNKYKGLKCGQYE